MKRNIVILGAVALIIVVILIMNGMKQEKPLAEANPAATSAAEQELKTAPEEGALAPAIQLSSMDGQTTYEVGGKRDKPVIINFWASWCGPCDAEAPDLMKVYDKYKDQVDLYAVNVTTHDTVRGAKDFVKEKGLRFPILMDTEGKTEKDYKVYAYPVNIIVDRDGVIRHRIEGAQSVADWEKMLKEVL
ncbi:TlpA disulfide reductase family protein [Cohnella lubricantis]|uniref:TlpA family protein disulfide reductase n=1 Tax=Cohnella lubricantis TaxID=2163172 RepID=A0A841TBJ7_9BACL|nr:TlpA disulfide reductase family protein [Cohnella lubricantis]MBB6678843.1 TlpA family protein disulfide reductase [Cohnella lubricantis]MBP2118254.1 thiol-disulfide isomerase/thioredoxin [Cohnella lubricantis]